MKKAIVFFGLLMAATSVQAQTITLGPITKLAYCVGDTLVVPYIAQGTFNTGNVFKVQLSDANGSFETFTSVGQDSNISGFIAVVIANVGNNYHVRVISTNPYRISDASADSIEIVSYPAPQPRVSSDGFAGDPVTFVDGTSEPQGSTYQWTFNQDANMDTSSLASPIVVYAKDGVKSGTLVVTNKAGCSITAPFTFQLFSCFPLIPNNVHVVTGTETGSDTAVWVMPGGNYTTSNEIAVQTIFAEPGSSVHAGFATMGLYYLRMGSSFVLSNSGTWATVILDSGMHISGADNQDTVDTYYCPNLTFDYSQVQSDVAAVPPLNLLFRQSGDQLFASEEELPIDIRITNLLGAEVLSKRGAGTVGVDLSSLPVGVYFAIVQAGDAREVKRIAVVH